MGQIEGHETDAAGAPRIERVSAKIAALERRAEHLEDQLAKWTRSPGGRHFAEGELRAIKGGIAALRYHRADIEGLDTPIVAMQELVDQMGKDAVADMGARPSAGTVAAFRRCEALLAEWGG